MCNQTGSQPLVATVRVGWQPRPVEFVRCAGCATIVPSAVIPPAAAYQGEHWDWDLYVEQTAGVEALAATLALVDAPAGSTFLDVGCGFGFGLDLAVRLRGWDGIGLDPSEGADRGRAALGLDLRRALLDPAFEPGRQFDVIFCSEVVEHLRHPQPVLAEIRDRLAPGGAAIITVPDAAVISPEQPRTVAEPAISIGHHEFIPTLDGFRTLLSDAGLTAEVWSRGTNLVAVAAAEPTGLARLRRDADVALADLASYAAAHVAAARPDSPLAVGMAMRRVKYLAYDGRITDAAAAIPDLAETLSARYGIDLSRPDSIAADGNPVPAVLAGACYFAGLSSCIVDREPIRGDRFFRAAARSGRAHRALFGRYLDPEVARFAMEALGELASLHAPTDPERTREALAELDAVAAECGDRAFADLYHARVDPLLV
ncbi:MAG: class I SAM-dependent methyltransferase [Actinomycetes bacterium]